MNSCKCFFCSIENVPDKTYMKWFDMMSDTRKKYVSNLRTIEEQKRSILGEFLARKAISKECGINRADICFEVGKYGKPFAVGLKIEFNISHSGNLVACAVSNKPIGIDVELIRPANLKIAKQICNDEELIHLFGHKPSNAEYKKCFETETLIRFFKFWTHHEAIGKYTGFGLQNTINQYECCKQFLIDCSGQKYAISIIY